MKPNQRKSKQPPPQDKKNGTEENKNSLSM